MHWFARHRPARRLPARHGIVHRDLKPGNIFIENGIVKVGDYGLSKFISHSRRSGQTESVGTVHYMAPEISHRQLRQEIDIYAAGDHPLRDAHRPRAVRRRERRRDPDEAPDGRPATCRRCPRRTAPIVGRLLDKDPQKRYLSLQAPSGGIVEVRQGNMPDPLPGAVTKPRPPTVPSPAGPRYSAHRTGAVRREQCGFRGADAAARIGR